MQDQDSAEPVTEISVSLTAEAVGELGRLHEFTGLSEAEIVSKAVIMYVHLHDELTRGGEIRLTRSDGAMYVIELS